MTTLFTNSPRSRMIIIGSLLISIFTTQAWSAPRRDDLQERVHRADSTLSGAWMGSYRCSGIEHLALLQLSEGYRGQLRAIFHGLDHDARDYLSFSMVGRVTEEDRGRRFKLKVDLDPQDWIENPGQQFVSVGLHGRTNGSRFKGRMEHRSCGEFNFRRLNCDLNSDSPCSKRARGAFARILRRDGSRRDESRGNDSRRNRRRGARRERDRDEDHDHHDDHDHHEPTAPAAKQALSDIEFRVHRSALRSSSMDDGKLQYLRRLPRNHYLSVSQAQVILKMFSFDPKRIEALKIIAPHLVDHYESFKLLAPFTFNKQREVARELLTRTAHAAREELEAQRRGRQGRRRRGRRRRTDRELGVGHPLSAELFSEVVAQLKGESFDEGKQSTLALVCEMNLMSVRQATEVLKFWSFDAGRLKALKLIAPRLTDPELRNELLNVFTFDAQRVKASEILSRIYAR